MGKIIDINEKRIKDHLETIVKDAVEETLNAIMEVEADCICNTKRYEHTQARADTRAGYYTRKKHIKAGNVILKAPKLRMLSFETALIERYRRREASVEESLIEMSLAGVSVRRVEDITEALWGTNVSPGTISNLNKKIYDKIKTWRNKPLP